MYVSFRFEGTFKNGERLLRSGEIFPSGSILFFTSAILLVIIMHPAVVSASDEFRGPRIEVGGSVGYVTVSQNPVWSAKNFRTGSVTGAFRIFREISVQGGYEGSIEEGISIKSLDYGSDMQLKKVDSSSYGSPWVGVRYEIQSDILKGYRFGSYSLYASLGYTWARFEVTTNEWMVREVLEQGNPRTKYHVADVSGPYGIIALRWRFDSDFTKNTDSWLGAYGFDGGLKYIRYTSCSTRYDTIEKSGSDFSFLQVFIIGFIKLSFFE